MTSYLMVETLGVFIQVLSPSKFLYKTIMIF